jgi:hypothetical protein
MPQTARYPLGVDASEPLSLLFVDDPVMTTAAAHPDSLVAVPFWPQGRICDGRRRGERPRRRCAADRVLATSLALREPARILCGSCGRITSAGGGGPDDSEFTVVQVAVEYGVPTSCNNASFRNALAGVETQTWVIGVALLRLRYLIIKKM